MAINPRIKQKAEDIRKKIFGSEVRESLASGIEAISEDVEATKERQITVEETMQTVIDETTGKDVISAPEIIAAHVDSNGTAHPNLKSRLDNFEVSATQQLQQKADETKTTDLQSQINTLVLTNGDSSAEVSQSRVDPTGKTFTTLKERLDTYSNNADLKLLNMVKNGNFATKNFWDQQNGTFVVSNNTATVTASGAATTSRLYQATSYNATANHKYYVRVKVRVTNASATNIYVYLKSGTNMDAHNIGVYNIPNPVKDQWYDVSLIATNTSYTDALQINVTQLYDDTATATGKVVEVKEVMMVDLTSVFQSEPTLDETNSLVSMIDGWFDGYATIPQKAWANYILNKIVIPPNSRGAIIVASSTSKNKASADFICDGVDDQIEIQQALDALPSGGKVVLLEGTYWLSNTLKIPSDITLEGQGWTNTIINAVDNFAKTKHTAMIANKNIITGDTGIVLRNFMTDVRKTKQGTTYNVANIYLENVSRCVVEHVRAKGSKEAVHGYFGYGVYYGGCAIMLRRAMGCVVKTCWVSHADYDNIGLYENCHYNIVDGNLIENNAYDYWNINNVSYRGGGIQITSFLGHAISTNNKLINNVIRDNMTARAGGLNVENKGIVLHSAEYTTVSGNHIINVNGDGIKCMVHPEHYSVGVKTTLNGVTITNNTIQNVRNAIQEIESCGIRVKGEIINSTERLRLIQIVIANNNISNIASGGIMIITSEDINIGNNIIRNTSASGAARAAVLIQGSNNGLINANTIDKTNGSYAVELADNAGVTTERQLVSSNLMYTTTGIRDVSTGEPNNIKANNAEF